MKLIFCPECWDVQKLERMCVTTCECGQAIGWYKEDGLHAAIGGSAIPIGFDNHDLARAIQNRPKEGQGERFEAFVIPYTCPTIETLKRPEEITWETAPTAP